MADKLRVLDLFSGIGGFSLGLERTGGFETAAFCEIEPFPRKVLAKHWPEVPCYEDVTKLTGAILASDGITGIDVITGGFPCQDISTAGKQAGIGEGTRSGLWSEIVRLIGELSPRFVIVENVANLLSGPSNRRGGWFGRVLGDLAECGYDAEWENIPAAALGAHHRRERVWIVAYPSQNIFEPTYRGGIVGAPAYDARCSFIGSRGAADVAHSERVRQQGSGESIFASYRQAHSEGKAGYALNERFGQIWRTEPDLGRVANGVSRRVDRLGGLGNAVVPQIPELIGNAILESLNG